MQVLLPRSGVHSRNDVGPEAGFTLVEVVMAMLLLCTATLGLVHLAGTAMITSRSALSATSLGVYAENALEAARDRGFAGIAPGSTTDTLNVRGIRYARRITIVDRSARIREIRVDIARIGGDSLATSALTYVVR